jgi:uncharacterized repeat protein (TIGR03803 family)
VLIQATDGNLYGTTAFGATGYGTVFKMTPSGKLTALHSFDYTDGGDRWAWLVQGTVGNFYGTTLVGGLSGVGTVFSLSVGLGPFVETQTTSGKVGESSGFSGKDSRGQRPFPSTEPLR